MFAKNANPSFSADRKGSFNIVALDEKKANICSTKSLQKTNLKFGDCKIIVKGTLNGTSVNLVVTISPVGWISCGLLQAAVNIALK